MKLFYQSKILLHLSYRESFGISICEGAICGCIPIVSRSGAIPEVMGDNAIYLDVDVDIDLCVSKIREVLSAGFEMDPYAIHNKYSIQLREKNMVQVINELYS